MTNEHQDPFSKSIWRNPSRRAGLLIAILVIAVIAYLRIRLLPQRILPIAYGVPLMLALWLNSRRVLWVMVTGFVAISLVRLWAMDSDPVLMLTHPTVSFVLVMVDMFVIASVMHVLIGARTSMEVQNTALRQSNRELVAREEEIARQNEELQTQTEELERQSEELSFANSTLAAREGNLEHLLDLSRSLTAELSRGEMMTRICDAAGRMLSDDEAAAAIIERRGDEVVVRCHSGFGKDGLRSETLPYDKSFLGLILARGQTGYLENISLRPELEIPQPQVGPMMRSILAAPLRIKGQDIGTVEIYGRHPRAWNSAEVSLIESLAAQASVSIENGQLFAEIDDQRRRFAAVFRTLPIGIIITNADGSDVRMNPAGAAMLGTSAELNFGQPGSWNWTLTRNGRPIPQDEAAIWRARRGEELRNEELDVARADGRHCSFLVSAAPFRDRQGAILGAVAAFTDVTAQASLQHELEGRRRDAEEASIRKTRFLASVSHDIRTPANAINLLAELLQRQAGNPETIGEIPEMARELQSSSIALVNLVSDVLDVARYDVGNVELQISEFNVRDLLREIVRQLSPLAETKGLSIDLGSPEAGSRDGSPVMVRADRVKLGRVLTNLINNAIKFTESGGVQLAYRPQADNTLEIEVADTGIGIAPEHIARIFDEFYQIQNRERDRSKGTGLGLSICKRLVEAMGGTVKVESAAGKGSCFTVSLPILAVAQPVAEVVHASAALSSAAVSRGDGAARQAEGNGDPGASCGEPRGDLDGLQILLVEDHESTRRAMALILADEGAKVLEAPDGQSGLRLLNEQHPDVMLLDMMLPDLDGREILRHLAVDRPASLKRVLVLTGDVTPERTQEVRRLGADALIHKPIDWSSLISMCRSSV